MNKRIVHFLFSSTISFQKVYISFTQHAYGTDVNDFPKIVLELKFELFEIMINL